MTREELLVDIASHLVRLPQQPVLRVAVDGVDAAGKSTLANGLATCIRRFGRPVIRTSIDGFHNPRSIRYQRGALSADGFYCDSFDLTAIVNTLLAPLGPGGTRVYRTAIFDYRKDASLNRRLLRAEHGSILLFDGIFLSRPELRNCWDFTIFVKADFQVTLMRALARDLPLFGSTEEIRRRYEARYIPRPDALSRRMRP
jgi:uridine kinase